jgi:NAD(P)H-nitrite reductase large subunit
VPESADTRIARLEASRDEHRELIRQVTPLVAQYAVLQERLGNFGGDLNEGLGAIREEVAELKKNTAKQFDSMHDDQKSRSRERRTMILALVVCGIGLFGTFVATAVPLLKSPPPITRTK